MKKGNIIIKLNEFENNKELLKYKYCFDDILLWPIIRYSVLYYVISHGYNLEQAHSSVEKLKLKDILLRYYYQFKLNPFIIFKKYPIAILSWTSYSTSIKTNNKYFNKRDDYFASIFSQQTVSLEYSVKGKFRYPRSPHNLFSLDLLDTIAKIYSKFIKTRKEDLSNIEGLLSYINKNIDFEISDNHLAFCKARLLTLSKKIRVLKCLYTMILLRINPRVVILQNASYGNRSYIIKWIKELGIKVAELQHGIVTEMHMAYNYGKIGGSNIYLNYLPDYYLTFGEYWNARINIPIQKIPIGSPHASKTIKESNPIEELNKNYNYILFISQPTVTSKLVEIAEKLSYLIKGKNYKIIFRLHPGELSFIDRFNKIKSIDNIILNNSGDIYNYIHMCKFVVACYSTVVFETILFKKPIFILQHDMSDLYIPRDFGIRFSTANEIFNKLDECNSPNFYDNSEAYWKSNWEKNYKDFISQLLNKSHS